MCNSNIQGYIIFIPLYIMYIYVVHFYFVSLFPVYLFFFYISFSFILAIIAVCYTLCGINKVISYLILKKYSRKDRAFL